MGLDVTVGTFTAISGTGNQSITGLGFQPKALFFFITDRTSAGNGAAARLGRGFTDGTNELAVASARQDSGAVARDRIVTTACITLVDDGGTLLSEASIVTLDSDGFTVNWGTSGGSRIVGYLALGGSDITNVHVGNSTLLSTDTTKAISGVGFQGDTLFIAGREDTTSFGTHNQGGYFTGVALSTTDRHSSSHRWRINSPNTRSGIGTDAVWIGADDAGWTQKWDFDGFDADGFDLVRDAVDAGSVDTAFGYMVIAGLSGNIARGTFQTPTSTGNQTISGVGVDPTALMFDSGLKATLGSWGQEAEIIAGLADADTDFAAWVGSASADPYGGWTALSTTKCLLSYDESTTAALEEDASLNSLGTDQFVLNWSTVDATQRYIGYVAIEEAVGVGALQISVSDSVTVSESTTVEVSAPQISVSESVTVSESTTVEVSAPQISVSESVTVTESTNITLAHNIGVSDAVSVAESTNATLVHNIDVADTVALAEAIKMLVTSHVDVSDAISVAESVTVSLVSADTISINVSDGITVSEAITLQIDENVNVNDAIAVAEAIALIITSFINVSDAVSVAESTNVTLVHNVNVSDAISVAENINATLVHNAGVSDAVSVSEAIKMLLTSHINVSESISVSESVTVSLVATGTIAINVNDSVTVGETTTLQIDENVNVNDAVSVTESVAVSLVAAGTIAINVSESVSVSDTPTLLLPELFTSVSESVSVADTPTLLLPKLFTSVSDSVTLADGPTVSIITPGADLSITVADTITVNDVVVMALLTTVALTLRDRNLSLTLRDRDTTLTLRNRP